MPDTFGEVPSGVEQPVEVEIDLNPPADGSAATPAPAERTGISQPAAVDGEDEDTDHADDAAIPEGATEAEREEIRTRRRAERTRRKQAAKARDEGQRRLIAAQQETINQLAGRVAAVERSGISTHINHVDGQLADVNDRMALATQTHANAVSLGDGQAAATAMEELMDLRVRKEQLLGAKRQLTQAVQQQQRAPTAQPQPQQAPPLPAPVQERVAAFIDRHKGWYNPASGNAESKIVMAVDQEVAEAGFDPATDDYWAEVEDRLRNYLPHRVPAAHNGARSEGNSMPRSPVSAGGARSQQAGGRGGKTVFTLSAERVAAMKESGAWNDPKRKAEQIKRFHTYDMEQAAKGGAK